MQKLNLRPHEYKRISGSQQVRLVRSTPYIRLVNSNYPPVYLQDGKFFADEGPELEKVPKWVKRAVKNLSDAGLKNCGFERVKKEKIEVPENPILSYTRKELTKLIGDNSLDIAGADDMNVPNLRKAVLKALETSDGNS